jgi:hypothetical protein
MPLYILIYVSSQLRRSRPAATYDVLPPSLPTGRRTAGRCTILYLYSGAPQAARIRFDKNAEDQHITRRPRLREHVLRACAPSHKLETARQSMLRLLPP